MQHSILTDGAQTLHESPFQHGLCCSLLLLGCPSPVGLDVALRGEHGLLLLTAMANGSASSVKKELVITVIAEH